MALSTKTNKIKILEINGRNIRDIWEPLDFSAVQDIVFNCFAVNLNGNLIEMLPFIGEISFHWVSKRKEDKLWFINVYYILNFDCWKWILSDFFADNICSIEALQECTEIKYQWNKNYLLFNRIEGETKQQILFYFFN